MKEVKKYTFSANLNSFIDGKILYFFDYHRIKYSGKC